jgi:DNA modification methylase
MSYTTARKRGANSEINKLYPEDRSVHEWYRFVLSFPPHLVREYLGRFGIGEGQRVLDPFCGTGTVLVECKKLGIESVGIEANAMAHYATSVKTDWTPDPDGLVEHARQVAEVATAQLRAEGIEDDPLSNQLPILHTSLQTLPAESMRLLLKDSISPLPLHKTLALLECLKQNFSAEFHRHELLALAKALVYSISNLHFGPEVGVGKPKHDAPVISTWLAGVHSMVSDLRKVQQHKDVPAVAHLADSRCLLDVLEPGSIDAVITSPPYPNEKDYTRTTRLESVLLGLIRNIDDLRALKKGLLRSNTRNVYKGDDDDAWIADYPEIVRIANEIEGRRIALGKTSGFEKLYAKVTKLYFGGMARHLAKLRAVMRPGAKLAYVVGDQASYLQVMIPTGQLLADIGKSLGYEVTGIDLFRTRLATATKVHLREEIVALRWPGESRPLVASTLSYPP